MHKFLGLFLLFCHCAIDAELRVGTFGDIQIDANAYELSRLHYTETGNVVLDTIDSHENLAIGSQVQNQYGRSVPLADGSIALGDSLNSPSEWLSSTPNVYGTQFTLDLGVNREISRVKVRAGETALRIPEYYIRGYRIEGASADRPELWYELAVSNNNDKLDIDSSADNTWVRIDDSGAPISQVIRYIRLTITKEDRSNWISIGDIEAYGRGYVRNGAIEFNFELPGQVNVGRLLWSVDQPDETEVYLRVGEDRRTYLANSLYEGIEPISNMPCALELRTADPAQTPALRNLRIEYDPVLVAAQAAGSVTPRSVERGVRTRITYAIDLGITEADYGVDRILLSGMPISIVNVSVNGRTLLGPGAGQAEYWLGQSEQGAIIGFAEDAIGVGQSTVEIEADILLLNQETTLGFSVGSSRQEAADGYLNWQNGRRDESLRWTENTGRTVPSVLEFEIEPQPFNASADSPMSLSFIYTDVQPDTEIELSIYSLDGRRVARMRRAGTGTGVFSYRWQGRDSDGRIVEPGLYLFECLAAGGLEMRLLRQGTFSVAY